ncbi:MAG: hypothetical protein EBR93_04580 [Bacteroidetes bacterium]|nr:hypothetical protein [Bacteroidota bacterium]
MKGYYSSEVSQHDCRACPPSTTTANIDSTSVSACSICTDPKMKRRDSYGNYDTECGGLDDAPCVCPAQYVRKYNKCLDCPLCSCGTTTFTATSTNTGHTSYTERVIGQCIISAHLTLALIYTVNC